MHPGTYTEPASPIRATSGWQFLAWGPGIDGFILLGIDEIRRDIRRDRGADAAWTHVAVIDPAGPCLTPVTFTYTQDEDYTMWTTNVVRVSDRAVISTFRIPAGTGL